MMTPHRLRSVPQPRGRGWWKRSAAILTVAILLAGRLTEARAATGTAAGGTLSLAEAIRYAETGNSEARLAGVRFEKADVAARQARDTADQISTSSVNSYARAQQKYVAARQAEANQAAAAAVRSQALRAVRLQAESGYYNLWLAQERVRVTDAGLSRAQEQLRISQAQYDAGAVARNDVLSGELQVASMEASLATANKLLETARIQLNSVLGRPLTDPFVARPVDAGPAGAVPEVEEGVAQALERRAETIRTRESVAVAELDARLAAEYYPESVNLRQVADLTLQEAWLQDEQARRQVEAEVRQDYLSIGEAQQRLTLANKSREQAEEAFRLATLRYQSGLATILEVTGAHVALYQAEAEAAKAQFDLRIAEAQYRTAICQD